MTHPAHCSHCRASLFAPRSRSLGALVVGVAWTLAMTMVFIGILTGPIIIFLLPMLVPAGVSMITTAHEWAFADWTCDACGKLVEVEAPQASSALTVARTASR
ncbi:hypothetical protein ACNOYE_34040 [Nannocystaceae bacterium ST9]